MNSEGTHPTRKSKTYEFGGFCLEAENLLLLKGKEVVQLEPKACEVLLALVRSNGRAVSKKELLERVWPDTFVEEANLSHHISALRKALGEEKNGPRFIETLPRRGYRFIAPVTELASDMVEVTVSERTRTRFTEENEIETNDAPEAIIEAKSSLTSQRAIASASSQRTRSPMSVRTTIALVAALVVALAVASYLWLRRAPAAVRTIAVLPFKLLSKEKGDDFLELGMADSLITRLSGIKQLTIRPTSSILRYSDTRVSSAAAGRELGVDVILEGWIQRSNESLRISVQLIRTSDGSVIWAETFDESPASLLRLQDSISEKVAAAISLNLTGEEKKSFAKRYTENAEAYQLYLQGRFYWYKWSEEGWKKAAEYFEKAIEKDPNYALAYAGLGDTYGASGMYQSPPKEAYLKSKEATLKALELDDSLAEAHITLGMLKLFYEWDQAGAREQLLYALKLSPNSALAHDCYAIYLTDVGKFEESILEAKQAQALDPLSPYMNGDLGMAYYYARHYDKAREHLNKALELDPDYLDSLEFSAAIYELEARYAEAVSLWQKISTINGDEQAAQAIAQAYAASGYKGAVEKRIEQLKERAKQSPVLPLTFAEHYARLGDKRQAIAWLNKAFEERSPLLARIKHEPRWDALRSDPEFQALLEKINTKP